MQIVNFTRRDMNLFQCKIGLRYETTPDQLRYVAAKIRKLLIQHSKVSPDPARVRLSEFGNSAYVLEVFAFVMAADWNDFLAIKEDLNLRIAEIVRDSGTSFAFPSQTVYFTRDTGVDAARGEATEARCGSGGRRSGCRFPTTISPSGPRWRTRCPSRPKARRTIGRAPPRAHARAPARTRQRAARLAGAASPRDLAAPANRARRVPGPGRPAVVRFANRTAEILLAQLQLPNQPANDGDVQTPDSKASVVLRDATGILGAYGIHGGARPLRNGKWPGRLA